MENKIILEVILFIVLTSVSSTFATLKNIFLSKDQYNAASIVIFLDALVFATIMKEISSGDGFLFTFAYGVGKVIGVNIGAYVEKKMALGIVHVEFSTNHFEKMVGIADNLRNLGYTVETYSTYGIGGRKRFKINVIISRKEIGTLESVLKDNGYDNPTMIMKDIKNVSGKVTISSNEH